MIIRDDKGRFVKEDLTGQKFGRLTAVEFSHKNKNRKTYWVWLCDCGNIHVARTDSVKNGQIQSCGCLKKEQDQRNLNRNGSKPKYSDIGNLNNCKIYSRWKGMKSRCYNPHYKQYHNYGGRGITVCDDWLLNFYNFYRWSIENGFDDSKDIHRIDNDGDYCPENCCYIDHNEHMRLHRGNQSDSEQAD